MEINDTSTKKSRLAMILYLILGKLGVHRFYVGKYITGAVFLLVGGAAVILNVMDIRFAFIAEIVSAVIVAADMYLICSGRFKDKNGNPIVTIVSISEGNGTKEKEKSSFIEKINKVMYISAGAAIYIVFCLIYSFAF
jgi:TM2 domain-containing membrane protein YozV